MDSTMHSELVDYLTNQLDNQLNKDILETIAGHINELPDSLGKGEILNKLGYSYELIKEYQKAYDYYEHSIQLGDPMAYNNLGLLVVNIYGNYKKAEELFVDAVSLGIIESYNNLAYIQIIYYNNHEKARKYYERAASCDNTYAMIKLGVMYLSLDDDTVRAKEYFSKAANLGDSEGHFNLGNLSVDDDWKKHHYIKSAKLGNIKAMNNLGVMYASIYKDIPKAQRWLGKAIQLNCDDAMYNLAFMYETNEYGPEKYLELYQKAADNNNVKAINRLNEI